MTGRMYPEVWAQLSALLIFVGFNLTFFPQFILGYLGMPRRYHAYPAGVPGAERAVDGRRLDPRRRLPAAARSTCSGRCATARAPAPTRGARPASSGRRRRRRRPRTSTATPVVDRRAVRPTRRRRRPPTQDGAHVALSRRTIARRSPHHFDDARAAARRRRRSGCGSSWSPRSCSSAACSPPTCVYRAALPGRLRTRPATHLDIALGAHQHRRAARQQPDHGAGRARRAARQTRQLVVCLIADHASSASAFLGVKAFEYAHKFARAPGARARTSTSHGADRRPARSSSSRSTSP